MQQRILIQGIGGLGGIFAAKLVENGWEPVLLTANQSITKSIKTNGIVIDGNTIFYDKVFTKPVELGDHKFDWIFLMMKANAVVDAAKQTFPHLYDDGAMVSFQNGIVEDDLVGILGEDHLVSGIVGFGATMLAPGVYEKTSPGSIHIGELDGSVTDRLYELKTILDPIDDVVITENIRGALWSKLAINATINSMGVITGQTLGEMLAIRRNRDIFLNIYREVIDTCLASGISPERIAANPMTLYRPLGAGWLRSLSKDIILRIVGRRYSNLKSSSLQSIERGRKTEVEFLNGYVTKMAKTIQVEVPYNEELVRLVLQIEEGELEINPSNTKYLII